MARVTFAYTHSSLVIAKFLAYNEAEAYAVTVIKERFSLMANPGFFARLDQLEFPAKVVITCICIIFGLLTSLVMMEEEDHTPRYEAAFAEDVPPPPAPPRSATSKSSASLELPARLVESENFVSDAEWLPGGQIKMLEIGNGEARTLRTSRDDGATWGQAITPRLLNGDRGNDKLWTKIHFTDARRGWAYGPQSDLWRTADGGKTWRPVRLPLDLEFISIAWVSPKVGYLAGNVVDSRVDEPQIAGKIPPPVRSKYRVAILCTLDGGRSWQKVGATDTFGTLWQLLAPTADNLILNISEGNMLLSNDGGRTWDYAPVRGSSVRHIVCNSAGEGWAVGKDGMFLQFEDFGANVIGTAHLPAHLAKANWDSIAMTPDGVGMAAGSESALVVTTNNGLTWEAATLSPSAKGSVPMFRDFDHVVMRGQSALIFSAGSMFRVEL